MADILGSLFRYLIPGLLLWWAWIKSEEKRRRWLFLALETVLLAAPFALGPLARRSFIRRIAEDLVAREGAARAQADAVQERVAAWKAQRSAAVDLGPVTAELARNFPQARGIRALLIDRNGSILASSEPTLLGGARVDEGILQEIQDKAGGRRGQPQTQGLLPDGAFALVADTGWAVVVQGDPDTELARRHEEMLAVMGGIVALTVGAYALAVALGFFWPKPPVELEIEITPP